MVGAVQSLVLSPRNETYYARILSILFSAGVCLGMQLAVCEFARNVLGWKGEWLHGLGRRMLLLPPVQFQLWMNIRRAVILICCSVVFRCQLYWIQSRIQVPCGQVSFTFCSILTRLSFTGITWTLFDLAGDRNARAQPWADGRNNAFGEKADCF